MKITVNVNIGGVSFVMDDDAYDLLKKYLSEVSQFIAAKDDKAEILSDIERRISEILTGDSITYLRVVTIDTVKRIISMIGEAAVFGDGDEEFTYSGGKQSMGKKLMRDSKNAMLGGVSSGLAAYIGIDTTLIRVILVVLLVFGGTGVVFYLVAWVLIPLAVTDQDQQMMSDMHNGLYKD